MSFHLPFPKVLRPMRNALCSSQVHGCGRFFGRTGDRTMTRADMARLKGRRVDLVFWRENFEISKFK
jgi:hypothetical protein